MKFCEGFRRGCSYNTRLSNQTIGEHTKRFGVESRERLNEFCACKDLPIT